MNTYQPDTLVKLSTTFTASDGVTPVDPTTVTLYVKTPDGMVMAHVDDIVRSGIGLYSFELITNQIGPWIYKWQGTGNCEITSPDVDFQVTRSAVMVP